MTLWIWVLACRKETDPDRPDPTGPTGHTGAPTDTAPTDTGTRPGPDLVATDANDVTLSVAYTVAEAPVRAGFDAMVSWSAVTTDGWGDPLAPAEVPRLVLLEITVLPSEVDERLARDDLGTDLLSTWEVDVTGSVFAHLSDLSSGSTPFDPAAYLLEDAGRSWVLGLASPAGERLALRSAVVLVPATGGGASSVTLVDGQSSFAGTASFDGAPLVTSAAWDAWTLDWSGLGTDALGRPVDRERTDQLFVARYAGGLAAAEAAIRDLPGGADAVWSMDVGGFTDARLEFALDDSGAPFPGFTAGDTWIVGGRCTTCLTPFPAFAFPVEVR